MINNNVESDVIAKFPSIRKVFVDFLDSDAPESLDLWLKLFPADPRTIVKNSPKREKFSEVWYKPIRYMNGNKYLNCVEFDFNAFSFNILKKYATGDVKMFCDFIDNLYEDFADDDKKLFRIKRLRIGFFTALSSVMFGLFDLDLYKKVQEEMYANTSKLVAFVRKHKWNIIAVGYDSVTIDNIESYDDLVQDIKAWDGIPVSIESFEKIIRFYNVMFFDYGKAGYKFKFMTKTDEWYDGLKQDICFYLADRLDEINWDKYEKKISDRKIKEYKDLLGKQFGI